MLLNTVLALFARLWRTLLELEHKLLLHFTRFRRLLGRLHYILLLPARKLY
jgi:hypothetical protein